MVIIRQKKQQQPNHGEEMKENSFSRKLMKNRNISIKTKVRTARSMAFAVMMYRCEE